MQFARKIRKLVGAIFFIYDWLRIVEIINSSFLRPKLPAPYPDKCVFAEFMVENAGKLGYSLIKTMDYRKNA